MRAAESSYKHGPIWPEIRILVVEDDPSALHLYTTALRRMHRLFENPEIVGVGSIAEAELKIKAGPKFDLILLDLTLPNGDGLYTIFKVSRAQAYPPAVVVLTGVEEGIAYEVEGIRAGATSWVRKHDLARVPINWELLERPIAYSLAHLEWLGPALVERSQRIAIEAVSDG
jgi:CheY-like chemotaxis protein